MDYLNFELLAYNSGCLDLQCLNHYDIFWYLLTYLGALPRNESASSIVIKRVMKVRIGVSAPHKVSKVAGKLQSKKCDFRYENMKNT